VKKQRTFRFPAWAKDIPIPILRASKKALLRYEKDRKRRQSEVETEVDSAVHGGQTTAS